MAGIGFSLKRLFDKKGIFNLCRAYGYAGIVTCGPMLLGILLLLGVSFASYLGGMDSQKRELMNSIITYSLLISLFSTSWFNLPVTRYISDLLYQKREDEVLSAFYGSSLAEIFLCFLLYGPFLYFSGLSLRQGLLALWFSLILIVVWNGMIFLTALKDYKSIALYFMVSLMAGFLLILIFILLGYVDIEHFLLGVIVSYGLLMCLYIELLVEFFPKKRGSCFGFLIYMDKYRWLVINGGAGCIGLYGHLVLMYFGPLRQQVYGLFYGAPQYDVPALFAFFSLLVTTVSFVTSVEVKFYPKYKDYYGLFNDQGSVKDIEQAGQEMLSVLRNELTFLGHKQLLVTILFIVIAPAILSNLPLGMTTNAISIFRFLCVGYGTYALANSMMLILLYFDDYLGAALCTLVFAVFSVLATIWQILIGSTENFGAGFFLGAILYYLGTVICLEIHTKKLPYYLLARQNIVPAEVKGPLAFLGKKMQQRALRKEKREETAKEESA